VDLKDTVATATPIVSTNVVVKGNLFLNGDIDFYAFSANASVIMDACQARLMGG